MVAAIHLQIAGKQNGHAIDQHPVYHAGVVSVPLAHMVVIRLVAVV